MDKERLIEDAMYKYGLSRSNATKYVDKILKDLKGIVSTIEEHKRVVLERMKGH